MTRHPVPGDSRGFTLVELLVVLVITGVLAGIAVPALLTARRAAYEASVKSDIKSIAKDVVALFVDDSSELEILDADGRYVILRDGVEVADGELSPGNEVSARSTVTASGEYCLSVSNRHMGARFWLADDASLRVGDCPL